MADLRTIHQQLSLGPLSLSLNPPRFLRIDTLEVTETSGDREPGHGGSTSANQSPRLPGKGRLPGSFYSKRRQVCSKSPLPGCPAVGLLIYCRGLLWIDIVSGDKGGETISTPPDCGCFCGSTSGSVSSSGNYCGFPGVGVRTGTAGSTVLIRMLNPPLGIAPSPCPLQRWPGMGSVTRTQTSPPASARSSLQPSSKPCPVDDSHVWTIRFNGNPPSLGEMLELQAHVALGQFLR